MITKLFGRAALALALLVTLIAGAVTPEPAQAQSSYKFYTLVVDDLGNPITSGAYCNVYTTGTSTFPTIYSDAALATARTNGWAISSAGECVWYSSATTSVDLIVTHKRGRTRYTGVSQSVNRVVLNRFIGAHTIAIPFATNASETSTGVTIPKGTTVRSAWIQDDSTASQGQWIQVGILSTETNGDLDGFCGMTLVKVGDGSAGGRAIADGGPQFKGCHAVMKASTTPYLDRYIDGIHAGALLVAGGIGTVGGHMGFYVHHGYLSDGVAKTVAYKTSSGSGLAGWIFLVVDEFGTDSAN